MFSQLLLLYVLLGLPEIASAVQLGADEHRLHQTLMRKYPSVDVRPVLNHSEAVQVEVELSILQLDELDEKNDLLSIVGFLHLAWNDPFLSWQPEQYGGISQIRLSMDSIWTPPLVPHYSPSPVEHLMDALAAVRSNGDVTLKHYVRFQTFCGVDMTHFPFDEQTCRIRLGSLTYSVLEMDILYSDHFKKQVDLSKYMVNMEWFIVEAEGRREIEYYRCCEEPYVHMAYTLHLKREGGCFVSMFVAPAVMVNLLLLVMFVLPVESGEKMTLGIGSLLVTVLMLDMLEDYIMTSYARKDQPLLLSYYIACLILTSISLALSACVVSVAHSKRQMPVWLHKLVLKPLACVFCVRGTNEKTKPGQPIRFSQLESEEFHDPSTGPGSHPPGPRPTTTDAVEEWRRLATALDRLLFCVFLLIDVTMVVILLPRALH